MSKNNQATVVIPTHNGGSQLLKCLESLAKQDSKDFRILLVDNASTDETISDALSYWRANSHSTTLRVVKEPRPGAQYARWTGALAAETPWLVFCDDDNLLRPNYIRTALALVKLDENVGLIGGFGVVLPDADTYLPRWFDTVKNYYACNGVPDEKLDMVPITGIATAGMVARKSVFERLREASFKPLLSGRTGRSLVAGEDIELCKAAAMAGFITVLDSRLIFDHIMPSRRITIPYLLRLSYAMGVARSRHRVYDYCLNPDLHRYRNQAWIHELRRSFKPFLKASLSLIKSRSPSKVEARVWVSYFYSLLASPRSFSQGICVVEELARRLELTTKN